MIYKETNKISNLFEVVIVLTVIIGFIGGIFIGNACAVPTARAIEAMGEIAENSYMASIYGDVATETNWGLTSIVAMIITWFIAFVSALLLYTKKSEIEILDHIAGKLYSIEKNQGNQSNS